LEVKLSYEKKRKKTLLHTPYEVPQVTARNNLLQTERTAEERKKLTSPHFMESKCLSLRSQEPATCPYPKQK
jgi:hypothetical protein